jgi:hypothetical protein
MWQPPLDSSRLLNGLVVTDVWPAAGPTYLENRARLLEYGAQLHQTPVDCLDYSFTMAKDGGMARRERIDLVVGFGMNLNCFGDVGTNRWSSTDRQYKHLSACAAGRKQFLHFNHQQVFSEALLGQSLSTTQILIHQDNHAFISPTLSDVACARVPLYNPPGEDQLFMKMGYDNRRSLKPLWCNVTGNVMDVLSHARGECLDVHSCIAATLVSGGTVLVVGAGELRHLRGLPGAEIIGRPIFARNSWTQAMNKWFPATPEHQASWFRYDQWVLTTPWGTAPHDESVVGRVNLMRLREWLDCKHATRRPSPESV